MIPTVNNATKYDTIPYRKDCLSLSLFVSALGFEPLLLIYPGEARTKGPFASVSVLWWKNPRKGSIGTRSSADAQIGSPWGQTEPSVRPTAGFYGLLGTGCPWACSSIALFSPSPYWNWRKWSVTLSLSLLFHLATVVLSGLKGVQKVDGSVSCSASTTSK